MPEECEFEKRYTVPEVARIACVSAETVRRDIRKGVLKARRKRHAATYVVPGGELRRWLDEEFEEVPGRAQL